GEYVGGPVRTDGEGSAEAEAIRVGGPVEFGSAGGGFGVARTDRARARDPLEDEVVVAIFGRDHQIAAVGIEDEVLRVVERALPGRTGDRQGARAARRRD